LIFIENLLAFELFSFHFDPRSCKSKYQTGQFAIIQRQELTFDSKKRCLKIPEVYSEVVNQRRPDNSMAKRKRTKGHKPHYKPSLL
jgi:hypothetical protein